MPVPVTSTSMWRVDVDPVRVVTWTAGLGGGGEGGRELAGEEYDDERRRGMGGGVMGTKVEVPGVGIDSKAVVLVELPGRGRVGTGVGD